MQGKDFLSISNIDSDELVSLIKEAAAGKNQCWSKLLERKVLIILFEKQSARTRTSFDVAMRQLGGEAIYISQAEVGLGKRESTADVARVMGRYADAIAARTYAHKTVEELAEFSSIPVINALSDLEHPCQALADLLTIYEKKGTLSGVKLAYIGDGNNVANSLVLACALAGMDFRIAAPAGYEITEPVLETARKYAAESGANILCTADPREAAEAADVIYTDTWTSMGQEEETEIRRKVFAGYQINKELLSLARPDAIFMHCLPAHRGEEVTDEVIDGGQSVVFDQAENRLHAQRTLLARMLGRQ